MILLFSKRASRQKRQDSNARRFSLPLEKHGDVDEVVLDLRVVMDTNVFVSGLFFSGPPYQILEAWQAEAKLSSAGTNIC